MAAQIPLTPAVVLQHEIQIKIYILFLRKLLTTIVVAKSHENTTNKTKTNQQNY